MPGFLWQATIQDDKYNCSDKAAHPKGEQINTKHLKTNYTKHTGTQTARPLLRIFRLQALSRPLTAALIRLGCFVLGSLATTQGVTTGNITFLALALLLIVVAFRGLREAPLPAESASPSAIIWHWLKAHRFAGLGLLALGCNLLADWIVARDELNLAAAYLWLVSLLLLVLATLRHDGISITAPALWPQKLRLALSRTALLETALVVAITLIGFVLRAYDLDHYPPSMHGDEGEMGVLALQILGGTNLPFFGASPFFGLPYLFNYLQAASLALFGHDEAGLRMLSVLFGTACIPLVYGIGRSGWGRIAGATAAWLMAISHLHIHYSRLGFIFIESVFGMVLFMYLLLRIDSRSRQAVADKTTDMPGSRLWLFVAGGLTLGLSQYFYYGSRVMPFVAGPLLLYLLWKRRASLGQIGALALAALLAFAPLGVYFLHHPDVYFGRIETVSIFRAENMQQLLGPHATLPAAIFPLLQIQFTRILGLFINGGDAGGFYFQTVSAFDTITSILLWLGTGVALTRTGRFGELAVLAWFWIGLLFGGVFTIDAPSAQRLMIMVPAVYLFGGIFVARAWQLIGTTLDLRLAWPGIAGLAVAGLFLLQINTTIYFHDYATHTQGLEAIAIARELMHDPSEYDAYLMGTPILYTSHGAIKFVARDAHVKDAETVNALPAPVKGRGTLVIAVPNHEQDLQQYIERYPGGTLTRYTDPVGRLVYLAYRIPPK